MWWRHGHVMGSLLECVNRAEESRLPRHGSLNSTATSDQDMGQTPTRPQLSVEQVRRLQRHVSFTEDEIRDWWREFTRRTRRDPAGRLFLSEDEFASVYSSVFPGRCRDFARHVFRSFDLDGDGRLDFHEFLVGLSVSGSMDTDKKLQWAFRVYDVGGRGYITRDGMAQIIKAVFLMIGPVRADDVKSPEEMTDQLFRELDRNKDDVISWQEFRDGAARHPDVLNLLQCAPPGSDADDDISDVNGEGEQHGQI